MLITRLKKAWISKPLAILCLFSILTPGYALTSGPVAPEYTSFEPIEAQNMVSTLTGDLTYNLPVVSIPGPEGGYPLSLSYHSGIKPDQEASWVGLGWTLNAGAINRRVSNYPDDFNGIQKTVNDFWEGGETKAFSVGLGYSGASFNMVFANDTYKGQSMGISAGYQLGSLSATASVAPYNGGTTVGIGYGVSGMMGHNLLNMSNNYPQGVGLSMGMSVNLKSGDISATQGVSIRKGGFSLGMNMSGGGGRIGMGGIGFSASEVNKNTGQLSFSSSAWSMIVPILNTGAYLTLGHSKQRYWSDQTDFTTIYGSLYPGNDFDDANEKSSFDCITYSNGEEDYNPNYDRGGSSPAFDSYVVTGQGIGGRMSPVLPDYAGMYRKEVSDVQYELQGNQVTSINKVQFKFTDEFSNAIVWEPDLHENLDDADYISGTGWSKVGRTQTEITKTHDDYANGKFASSRSIEWYTVEDVNTRFLEKGIIRPHANGVESTLSGFSLTELIGGYRITNPSGVTYHYNLPVYAYDEVNYQQVDGNDGMSSQTLNQKHPYAYTWLLTAITGPDYVDRGSDGLGNGYIDSEDWGYWVKFDYGKWVNDKIWRNPSYAGMYSEGDRASYSAGRKQLYYLDAVSTRTHTALFPKSIRRDNKGTKSLSEGGHGVIRQTAGNQELVKEVSKSSLKLDDILLFKNTDLQEALLLSNEDLAFNPLLFSLEGLKERGGTNTYHEHDQVLESSDLKNLIKEDQAILDLQDYVLKKVAFTYDYELCGQTPNSFELNYDNLLNFNHPDQLGGKLSLQSIQTFGKAAQQSFPATSFNYSENPEYNKDAVNEWGDYYLERSQTEIDNFNSDWSDHVAAWSLNEISTPFGAKVRIQYESDEYQQTYFSDEFTAFSIEEIQAATAFTETAEYPTELIGANNPQAYYKVKFKPSPEVEMGSLLANVANGFALNLNLHLRKEFYNNCEGEDHRSATVPRLVSYQQKKVQFLKLISETEVWVKDLQGDYLFDVNQAICQSVKIEAGLASFDRNPTNILSDASKIRQYGGGVRVHAVSLESDRKIQKTTYHYSEGITTMDRPHIYGGAKEDELYTVFQQKTDVFGNTGVWQKNYKEKIIEALHSKKYRKASSHISMQGVIYGETTVHNSTTYKTGPKAGVENVSPYSISYENNIPDSHFKLFHVEEEDVIAASGRKVKMLTFKSYLDQLGVPKRTVSFGPEGIITISENHYLHEYEVASQLYFEEKMKNQGRFDELYYEQRRVLVNNVYEDQLMITCKKKKPLVLLSTSSENYLKNIISESHNLDWDFYTGDVISVGGLNANGNWQVSKSYKAYKHYPDMGFSLSDFDPSKKRMLSQDYLKEDYLAELTSTVKPLNLESFELKGLLTATIQEWGNKVPVRTKKGQNIFQDEVWRKKGSYAWIGDVTTFLGTNEQYPGLHSLLNYTSSSYSQDDRWLATGKAITYGVDSKVLEVIDMYGVHSCVLMDPYNIHTLFTVQNASTQEVAYSGAESFVTDNSSVKEGNTLTYEGLVSTFVSHTGEKSLKVDHGKEGFKFEFFPQLDLMSNKKNYFASVWVYLPGQEENEDLDNVRLKVIQNGQEIVSAYRETTKKARSWFLLEAVIDANTYASNQPLVISCENINYNNVGQGGEEVRAVYFDDFRVLPLQARGISYVYDQHTSALTALLNNDNLFTSYLYDDLGRLTKVQEENFSPVVHTISEQRYNYGQAGN